MFKYLLILAVAVIAINAQFKAQSNGFKAFGTKFFTSTYKPIYKATTRPPVVYQAPVQVAQTNYGPDRDAQILRYESDLQPDGSYQYSYETSNGIAAQEVGTPKNFGGQPPVIPVVAQGSFSWVDPEGKTITIQYVADENGYQPTGDALPTPPPIPAAILRSLEFNRKYGKNE